MKKIFLTRKFHIFCQKKLNLSQKIQNLRESLLRSVELTQLKWSGRQDSNLRPPVPKTGALPGCATPRLNVLLNNQDTFGKTLSA